MKDFVETSCCHGCSYGEFDNLSKSLKRKLIKIMARIMEKSYRRGVHQALYMQRNCPERLSRVDTEKKLQEWRYDICLDKSIGIDGFLSTSKARLHMEHRCLVYLGLGEE